LPRPHSIAVLYFDNLTRDTAYAYLADGITEELIARLGMVQRLEVRSRFESQRVRNRHALGARELGRILNAAYLLSGSVRSMGGRLRVTVELVRVPSDARLWGDVLNRSGSELLEIQEEITARVTQAVLGRVLPQERVALSRRATPDSAAYDLYLRARHFNSRGDRAGDLLARDLLLQAVARDSTFAPAWAGLAHAWAGLADNVVPAREAYQHTREAAERALALDSAMALAYVALTWPVMQVDYDFSRAELLARRAVALDPHLGDASGILSHVLLVRGKLNEALAQSRHAWQVDSLSGSVVLFAFWNLAELGRAAEAIEMLERAQPVLGADFVATFKPIALLYLRDCEQAQESLQTASSPAPWVRAIALACPGENEMHLASVDSLTAPDRRLFPTKVAEAYAAIGQLDSAFALLERAYDERDAMLLLINRPAWWRAALHRDPRFAALMQRIGLPWPAPQIAN
jgi:TolB-like protein